MMITLRLSNLKKQCSIKNPNFSLLSLFSLILVVFFEGGRLMFLLSKMIIKLMEFDSNKHKYKNIFKKCSPQTNHFKFFFYERHQAQFGMGYRTTP